MTNDVIPLSDEQNIICNDVVTTGHDVIVSSFAGTGKTTVILATAVKLYKTTGKKTLIVTYSSALRYDVKNKLKRYGRTCDGYVAVETFHSLCNTKYFPVTNDKTLRDFIRKEGKNPQWDKYKLNTDFIMVAFDEIQDAGTNEYRVIDFVMRRITNHVRVMFIGDVFQCIYKRMRQKTMDDVFALTSIPREKYSDRTFKSRRLSISFRITPEIATAVNTYLDPTRLVRSFYPDIWSKYGKLISDAWGTGIKSGKGSIPGSFTIQGIENIWDITDDDESFRMILDAHDDRLSTCILVGSTKVTCPAYPFIRRYGVTYNFYVVPSGPDRNKPDAIEKVSKDKIGVRTTFASKGLEWDVVVDLGLSGYHEKKDPFLSYCIAYTTWTRAKRRLHVIYDMGIPFMAFRPTSVSATDHQVPGRPVVMSVSEVIAYVPVKSEIDDKITMTVIQRKSTPSYNMYDHIQSFTRSGNVYFEDISPIIGSVVERIIGEWVHDQTIDIEYTKDDYHSMCMRALRNMNSPHLERQVNSFDFIDDVFVRILNTYVRNTSQWLGSTNVKYEYHKCVSYNHMGNIVNGEVDLIATDGSSIVELKTSKGSITHEHCKQVACYGVMYSLNHTCNVPNMYVFNCITNELVRVNILCEPESFIYNVVDTKLHTI